MLLARGWGGWAAGPTRPLLLPLPASPRGRRSGSKLWSLREGSAAGGELPGEAGGAHARAGPHAGGGTGRGLPAEKQRERRGGGGSA